jgi:hypothetical protein
MECFLEILPKNIFWNDNEIERISWLSKGKASGLPMLYLCLFTGAGMGSD